MLNYNFPIINHIDDVLAHIKDFEEVKVYDKDWYIVVDYAVAFEETFARNEIDILGSAVRRECRGLLFDKETGVIISRPYHKFFNVGEKEETQLNLINLYEPHFTLSKLDGSMIRPIPSTESFRLGTRAGITETSHQAEEYIKDKSQYSTFINKCIQKGTTPIFEWVSRKNRIVIDYPEDNLILTGIRYNNTGEYVPYDIMSRYAFSWNIPIVKVIAGDEKDISKIVEHIREWKEDEGVIIRFDTGHMIKIKADDYVLRHKTKEQISLEKNVINVILNDSVDDLIPLLYQSDAERLKEFQKNFWNSVDDLCKDLTEMFVSANSQYPIQKDFSVEFVIKEKLSKSLAGIMYAMRTGKSAKELVIDKIQKSTTTQTKVNENRWLFGNLKWN